ncbi:MAG TPA: transcription antitermination factor NusB [Candidatus Paceibacterota bacterium]
MANRHLSRSIALQALFEWDFITAHKNKVDEVVLRLINEFGEGAEKEFIVKLVRGILKKREVLDTIIAKAAKDWPLDQTPLVDRNVLRLGLYELLFASKEEVPARVAINEAIELAKSFGGERSGKFINGVLGTIYKEMGEPGKDDLPKKKTRYKRKEDLTPEEKEKLPLKKLVGAVVYCKDTKKQVRLAFVHDVFGYWTLSKGGVEEDEDEAVAVVREIKEEMSLDITNDATIGVNEYVATDPERGNIRKRVTYFLANASNPDAIKLPPESGGLDDAKWFTLSEVEGLKTYPDVRPIIEKGLAELAKKV